MLQRIVDGRTDLVFDYLAAGHPPDSDDGHGVPLIRWCAYYGDVSAIRHLLACGAPLGLLGDNLDLNGATFHGHWRLVQFLLENGADPNLPLTATLETPLHAATSTGHQPAFELIVRLLLAAGADPNRATAKGAETGNFMRDCRTRSETPLHRAAAYGSPETIRMLIDAGAAVDARDGHGDSPLTWASWHGRPAWVLDMLAFGEHRIAAAAVSRSKRPSGDAGPTGMDLNLLGTPHL